MNDLDIISDFSSCNIQLIRSILEEPSDSFLLDTPTLALSRNRSWAVEGTGSVGYWRGSSFFWRERKRWTYVGLAHATSLYCIRFGGRSLRSTHPHDSEPASLGGEGRDPVRRGNSLP